MKYNIKKIDLSNLVSLIKKMSSMDTSVYLNIDNKFIWSSVYTPTRTLVKSITMPLDAVMEFDKEPKDVIKLSFFSGSKLLQSLSYFDKNQISAEIDTYEEDGNVYAEKIVFKDNVLKITINCQDISLGFTSMTDNQIKTVFDETTKDFMFKLSSENLQKIISLGSLDKNEYLSIYGCEDGIHLRSESFDIVLDDKNKTKSKTKEYTFFKTHLSKMDKEIYDVSVCDQKLLFYSTESDSKLALNLVIIA